MGFKKNRLKCCICGRKKPHYTLHAFPAAKYDEVTELMLVPQQF